VCRFIIGLGIIYYLSATTVNIRFVGYEKENVTSNEYAARFVLENQTSTNQTILVKKSSYTRAMITESAFKTWSESRDMTVEEWDPDIVLLGRSQAEVLLSNGDHTAPWTCEFYVSRQNLNWLMKILYGKNNFHYRHKMVKIRVPSK